jgi:GH18 family chitinase
MTPHGCADRTEKRRPPTAEESSRRSSSTNYVKAHHLGGIMFWELSEDRNEELLDVIARSMRSKW